MQCSVVKSSVLYFHIYVEYTRLKSYHLFQTLDQEVLCKPTYRSKRVQAYQINSSTRGTQTTAKLMIDKAVTCKLTRQAFVPEVDSDHEEDNEMEIDQESDPDYHPEEEMRCSSSDDENLEDDKEM